MEVEGSVVILRNHSETFLKNTFLKTLEQYLVGQTRIGSRVP